MRKRSSSTVKVYYPEFSQEEMIEKIRGKINELLKKIPLESVTLFGSYAEKRQTAASDIDLLIIYKGHEMKDAYSTCWDIFKIPQLQIHIYTSSQYEKLKASGSLLPKEVEKKGIIIWSPRA